ncbi:MAG: hypothetical protein AABW56_02870 [Nanoarchaeota archaeon]
MQLEQTLQNYQIRTGEDYRISGGLYELLSGQRGEGIKWTNPCMRESFRLESNSKNIKLFSSEVNIPLIRIDREAHHGLPPNHLQLGKSLYTGRSGDEAYDLVAEILKNKPNYFKDILDK